MAVDILNTTTLSEALTAETADFTVASTTNIVADKLLVIRGEVMKVHEVPVSGRVRVARGFNGTRAIPHPTSHRVFIGDPEDFKAIKDSATALVGNSGTLPDYLLPGMRAIDYAGNEYVLLEMTETVYTGVTVVISNDANYTAGVLASGVHGRCAVMAEPATSDQYAWGLINGYMATAQEAGGTSAATSAYFPIAATSVSSPAAGMAAVDTSSAVNGFTINGMFIVGAAVSTTTSATSVTGVTVPVIVRYPWVEAAAPGSS